MHVNNEFNSTSHGTDVLSSSETAHNSTENSRNLPNLLATSLRITTSPEVFSVDGHGNMRNDSKLQDSGGKVKGGKIDYLDFDRLLRGDSNLFHKLVPDDENDFHKPCKSTPTATVTKEQRRKCNPLRQRRPRNRETVGADDRPRGRWRYSSPQREAWRTSR